MRAESSRGTTLGNLRAMFPVIEGGGLQPREGRRN